jgi:endonuclease YncB( thermonuclease family)
MMRPDCPRSRTPIYLIGIIVLLLWAVITAWLLHPAAADPLVVAIDGDTLDVDGERIRIIGLDAPETYEAHCSAELRLGQRSTNYMRSMVTGGIDIQRTGKRDRYGRSLAHVYFRGEDVAAVMVRQGLAVPYICGRHCGRRINWCAKLGG